MHVCACVCACVCVCVCVRALCLFVLICGRGLREWLPGQGLPHKRLASSSGSVTCLLATSASATTTTGSNNRQGEWSHAGIQPTANRNAPLASGWPSCAACTCSWGWRGSSSPHPRCPSPPTLHHLAAAAVVAVGAAAGGGAADAAPAQAAAGTPPWEATGSPGTG